MQVYLLIYIKMKIIASVTVSIVATVAVHFYKDSSLSAYFSLVYYSKHLWQSQRKQPNVYTLFIFRREKDLSCKYLSPPCGRRHRAAPNIAHRQQNWLARTTMGMLSAKMLCHPERSKPRSGGGVEPVGRREASGSHMDVYCPASFSKK